MKNLFTQFNELDEQGKIHLVTSNPKPAFGGWTGNIYKEVDGENRVFAVLIRPEEPEIIGIIPERYISLAEKTEYDPYDDALYARSTIELTQLALANAEIHQIGKKQIKGKCHLFDEELFGE